MIVYTEDWLFKLLFQMRGSVALRAGVFAIPCAALSAFLVLLDDWAPDFRNRWDLLELGKSQLWTAATAALAMLLAFRTNRAMGRFWEGTGLLHQMRGEWFDSISCCVTFSNGALVSKRKEVKRFRHTIVRLMSLCHASALEEICCTDQVFETIDCLGLDDVTLCYMKSCKEELQFNRVEVLLHLTQLIITKALDDGVLKIPPPILSRVYQTLSRGFVNLLNAKKIADTRFPFPYAQLIAILLFQHVLLIPIMISCSIPNKVWAPIFTFVPLFAMFSINFIGIELENPFGSDLNDLPLEHFQSEMNKCLLMLLHEGSDIIATVNDSRCIMKYKDLAGSMEPVGSRFTEAGVPNKRPSITDTAAVTNLYETGGCSMWDNCSTLSSTRSNHTRTNLSHSSGGGKNQCIEPAVAALISRPSSVLEEEGDARSQNDVSRSHQTAEETALELRRNVPATTDVSDVLHGTVDETSMYANSDAGCATAMARMDLDKTCAAQDATLIATPRESSEDCSIECAAQDATLVATPRESTEDCTIDHVAQVQSGLTPFSPVQQASIGAKLVSERSGPVLLSDKCHPSTPRQ